MVTALLYLLEHEIAKFKKTKFIRFIAEQP